MQDKNNNPAQLAIACDLRTRRCDRRPRSIAFLCFEIMVKGSFAGRLVHSSRFDVYDMYTLCRRVPQLCSAEEKGSSLLFSDVVVFGVQQV